MFVQLTINFYCFLLHLLLSLANLIASFVSSLESLPFASFKAMTLNQHEDDRSARLFLPVRLIDFCGLLIPQVFELSWLRSVSTQRERFLRKHCWFVQQFSVAERISRLIWSTETCREIFMNWVNAKHVVWIETNRNARNRQKCKFVHLMRSIALHPRVSSWFSATNKMM